MGHFRHCVSPPMNWDATWHGFPACSSTNQTKRRAAAGKTAQISSAKGRGCNLHFGRRLGRFVQRYQQNGGYVWIFMDIHRYLWIVMDIWYGLLAKTRSPTLNFHQVSSYKQLLETGIDSSHYAVGLASETGPRVSSQSFSIQLGHRRFLIPNCGYGTHERVHLLTLKVVCLFFFLFFDDFRLVIPNFNTLGMPGVS